MVVVRGALRRQLTGRFSYRRIIGYVLKVMVANGSAR